MADGPGARPDHPISGTVLSPGGIVTMVMMFVTGRLVGKIQPKYLIVAGGSSSRYRCTR
jgi:MFS transporter, DHA2 family, multidrug resistance protein